MRSALKLLCLTFTTCYISISIYAQDYYSGKALIEGHDIEYVVTEIGGLVHIENLANIKSHAPIIWMDEGKIAMWETRPMAECDYRTIRNNVLKVFKRNEIRKYSKGNNHIEIGFIIDPLSGKTIEVSFTLCNDQSREDNLLLSIPIEKIEQLELLLKQNLYWKVAPGSEKASHIGQSISLFWDIKHRFLFWDIL